MQPEEQVRKRQRVEEPGGKDKPIVGHLAAVAHAIVGWPQGARQPRSPALPQVVPSAGMADGHCGIPYTYHADACPQPWASLAWKLLRSCCMACRMDPDCHFCRRQLQCGLR